MIEIVDTHQHLWDPSRHAYGWCAGIDVLNRGFVYEDYLRAAGDLPEGFRIVQSVHVEAAPDEADVERETDWILSLARAPASLIAGVVAGCRPERPDFGSQLERMLANPEVKGARRVLHTEPDALSTSAAFRDALRQLGATRLSFDLCVRADQLATAIDLVRAVPSVRFILDHCGVPDVKGGALDPWRDQVRALASCENVIACKISGLVAYADPAKDLLEQVRPFVDHALAAFGVDRVMFGTDWPVCLLSCPMARWVSIADALTRPLGESGQRSFFADNARRVYRLATPDRAE